MSTAVRTVHEGLRTESTDGVMRTTAICPGHVRTDLADSMAGPHIREQTRKDMDAMGTPAAAVARAVAFAPDRDRADPDRAEAAFGHTRFHRGRRPRNRGTAVASALR
jgi:NADP-dependent 3-hydroxy acid dehydrogenase YdfG